VDYPAYLCLQSYFFQQPLFPGDSGVDQLVEIIKVNYYLHPN